MTGGGGIHYDWGRAGVYTMTGGRADTRNYVPGGPIRGQPAPAADKHK